MKSFNCKRPYFRVTKSFFRYHIFPISLKISHSTTLRSFIKYFWNYFQLHLNSIVFTRRQVFFARRWLHFSFAFVESTFYFTLLLPRSHHVWPCPLISIFHENVHCEKISNYKPPKTPYSTELKTINRII